MTWSTTIRATVPSNRKALVARASLASIKTGCRVLDRPSLKLSSSGNLTFDYFNFSLHKHNVNVIISSMNYV